MTESETRNACAKIHPQLLPFVEQCLAHDALNTEGGILEVMKPRSSTLDFENGRNCDRFTLGIPYCGAQIEWEVIFDRNHPFDPPDLIFSTEDNRREFCPDLEKLQSLTSWNSSSSSSSGGGGGGGAGCLCALLEELLVEYRQHHTNLLSQYQRLNFELHSLLEGGAYSSISVHCSSPDDNEFDATGRFYIPLAIDFSSIPAYLTKDNPGPDTAALLVTFHPPNGSRVTSSLFLSPRVERMLGGSQHLQLPAWGSKCGSRLMDYVPAVHRLLEEKVEAIVQSYISRKECVAAFLSVFGSSVLEYDTEGFKIMAFLFEFQHFYFIVKLELSDEFPQEQPLLVLYSVYHRLQGLPCQSVVSDYPYSPRWNPDEKAERMRSYLLKIAQQFKDLSKEKGQFL